MTDDTKRAIIIALDTFLGLLTLGVAWALFSYIQSGRFSISGRSPRVLAGSAGAVTADDMNNTLGDSTTVGALDEAYEPFANTPALGV